MKFSVYLTSKLIIFSVVEERNENVQVIDIAISQK